MNEKEVKEAAARAKASGAVCSVTGRRCKCDGGGGCRAYRTSVDNLPLELQRRIKTLWLRVDTAHQACLHVGEYDDRLRVWPQPEIRNIERKLEVIARELQEILGD